MAKAGDEYRELVGNVARALDPEATVKTEQWIEGPDGDRDMDVEVRGTLDGQPHFVLVECKDHKRPVGIGLIDAFESKCRDLKPDRRIMFSNSGFTEPALRKGARLDIEMASALKAMDPLIRGEVKTEFVARRLTIKFGTITIWPFEGHLEDPWQPEKLTYDGLPVIRWINEKMKSLAAEHPDAEKIKYTCTFRQEPRWAYGGEQLNVGALRFWFSSKKDCVSQTVIPNVSLGYFDHVRGMVVVPEKQWYTLGFFDHEGWQETDKEWESTETEPNTFRIDLILTRSNLTNIPGEPPGVNELIAEEEVQLGSVAMT